MNVKMWIHSKWGMTIEDKEYSRVCNGRKYIKKLADNGYRFDKIILWRFNDGSYEYCVHVRKV